MITKVVVILVASFIALIVAAQATDICVKDNEKYKKPTSRGMAYFLCVVFVFAGSVLWGLIVATPSEPGDEIGGRVVTTYIPGLSRAGRDGVIENTFLVTIIPALIGVRLGLGKKRTPDN